MPASPKHMKKFNCKSVIQMHLHLKIHTHTHTHIVCIRQIVFGLFDICLKLVALENSMQGLNKSLFLIYHQDS